jgi:hypothetical protein
MIFLLAKCRAQGETRAHLPGIGGLDKGGWVDYGSQVIASLSPCLKARFY